MIAVNDAYRRVTFVDVLYACDGAWWDYRQGAKEFAGERWSSHGSAAHDDKTACAERWKLNLVAGRDAEGFSLNPAYIHYGGNSGFQAINLAMHFIAGIGRIVLVGFDMRAVDGKRHFFGDHPPHLKATTSGYRNWPPIFAAAARRLPPQLEIVNATPGSALTCFPFLPLHDAIGASVHV